MAMALYLIAVPDDDPGEPVLPPELIKRHFPEPVEVIKDRLWVVESSLKTCGRVADKLELGADNRYLGVVFKIKERYGYHYATFWDDLQAMEDQAS